MDPVDPHIHVIVIGQVALPKLPILLLPHGGQPRDGRGTQAGRVLAEQHRQRLAEVARREPPQIKDGQHLRHLRGAAHIGRENPAREPLAVAVGVHPFVVHAGRPDFPGPGPAGDLPRLGLPVADHQPVALFVAVRGVGLDILRHLHRQGLHQHPTRSFARERVQRRTLIFLFWSSGLLVYLQHGWRLLSPGRPARVFVLVHTKGYAAFFTLPIHNFRLYLVYQLA